MDFLKLAADRYSVRKFTNTHLEQEIIDKILKAGHLAPTGCNYQPQRILVINNDEAIEKLKKCTKCHFDAPTAILACYNKDESWVRKYDGALIVATQNIDDFVGTSEEMRSKASAVINNCQYSMLFGLKADDINKVQDLYSNYGGGLTAEEVDFLAKAELGQMLLLAEPERRTIVQVNLMPDEKQYIERV